MGVFTAENVEEMPKGVGEDGGENRVGGARGHSAFRVTADEVAQLERWEENQKPGVLEAGNKVLQEERGIGWCLKPLMVKQDMDGGLTTR